MVDLLRPRPAVASMVVMLASAAVLVGCGGTTSTTSSADTALDQAVAGVVHTTGGPPGIISVVDRDGQVKVHAAGLADLVTGAAPAPGDYMRIASVAKAFSGAAALALVADGRLSLDDTISKRLPSLPPAWGPVTLGQALQHTSGIPDYTASPATASALMASPLNAPPAAQLLSSVTDQPLEFTPGSQYRYSNSDNIVVGLMIQAVTGRPYDQVLQTEVDGPLGLQGTSLPSDVGMPTPFIHGYELAPPKPPEDGTMLFAPGWAWASGGIVSTPSDLNRFVRTYARGATTNPTTHAQQLQFVKGSSDPPGPGTNDAGLGIFRYSTRCGTVYGHTGNITGGYTQFMAATRDGSRSATVSINSVITPQTDPAHYPALQNIFELASCAALAGT